VPNQNQQQDFVSEPSSSLDMESKMPTSVSNSFQNIIDYVSTNIANKVSSLLGYTGSGQDQTDELQNGFIANNINNRIMGSSQGGKTKKRKLYRSKKRTYRK